MRPTALPAALQAAPVTPARQQSQPVQGGQRAHTPASHIAHAALRTTSPQPLQNSQAPPLTPARQQSQPAHRPAGHIAHAGHKSSAQPLQSSQAQPLTPVRQQSQPAHRPASQLVHAAPRTAAEPLQDTRSGVDMDRWWEDAVDTTEAGEEYWADAEVELGIDLNQPPEEVELGERDAESQAVAVALATIAQDTKAQGVRVLGVGHLVSWTSYFVIATVTSQPQMNAALGRITREARDRFELAPLRTVDGRSPWEVLDYGEVVVHLMFSFERQHYDLEGKFHRAMQVELPDATESDAPLDWRKNLVL